METRYSDADAQRSIAALQSKHAGLTELLALRTYTARLLGADASLVLHGGGNTSVKTTATTLLGETVDVLHIKGSGWDLATIEPAGHPAVRMAPLRRLRALSSLGDEDMVNELRLALLDASAPTPSVETLLHAFLPATFIDHTHADALLAIADQKDAERICREIYGKGMVWVPYVMPGFALALRCADAFDALVKTGTQPNVIVLERHGLFTFGETAKESYQRMIECVTLAQRHVVDHLKTASIAGILRDPAKEAWFLPRLRGALAELANEPTERGPILTIRSNEGLLAFLARKDARALVDKGCATPDHVLRTKPTALLLDRPDFSDPDKLAGQLRHDIADYATRYDAYFEAMCTKKGVSKKKLDPWPRIVLVPGIGICAIGKTKREGDIAADIYEHTIDVMSGATDVGAYSPVSREDLFDVEYWSLEQAKLKKTEDPPLQGRIALVTGAASGIGKATTARLLALGAHVTMVDRDATRLALAHAELSSKRKTQVTFVIADVTNAPEVEGAIMHSVRTFGGLDLVVSNAGSAAEGRLHTKEGDDGLRKSLELNLLSHNTVARVATDVMTAQGRGGCLLFNASKSAFNQGPDFGPYAIPKAALIALMRQYAVDLGKVGIRSNAINADRIRTQLFGGGFVESRAVARGFSVDEYFRANLLEREVTADQVADAFAYLATAHATTGCVITVDGGNAAAFPR